MSWAGHGNLIIKLPFLYELKKYGNRASVVFLKRAKINNTLLRKDSFNNEHALL